MTTLGFLIPVSIILGGLGLLGFIWCVLRGQFNDLEGDQHRALFEDDPPDK